MKNLSTKNQFKPQGMAGFFGWLKRTVKNVVNAVKELSHNPLFIFNILLDALDGNGFNLGNNNVNYSDNNNGGGNTGNYISRTGLTLDVDLFEEVELTGIEEQKLDTWVENNYLPYLTTFFIRIKQFYLTNPTQKVIIDLANEIEIIIGLSIWYKQYVKIHGDSIFSGNAIIARSKFIDIQSELLRAEFNQFLKTKGIVLQSKIVKRNVDKSEYLFLNFNMPNSVSINVKQYGTNLKDELPMSSGSSNVSSGPANANSKSSNLLLLALLGLGVYIVASSSDDDDTDDRSEKLKSPKAKN